MADLRTGLGGGVRGRARARVPENLSLTDHRNKYKSGAVRPVLTVGVNRSLTLSDYHAAHAMVGIRVPKPGGQALSRAKGKGEALVRRENGRLRLGEDGEDRVGDGEERAWVAVAGGSCSAGRTTERVGMAGSPSARNDPCELVSVSSKGQGVTVR